MGALPDFVIIGAQKCGTTYLYQLLTKHPNVQSAAVKELHYFDRPEDSEKDIEWYQRCFPPPQWKNGQISITGEKSPSYLFHPHAAERMAQVVPEARLIVLLRNPVDRAYSNYRHDVRREHETRTFEEAIEVEQAQLLDKEDQGSEHEHPSNTSYRSPTNFLAKSIYVDQLVRWRQFFSEEQLLVLKSEDFYENTIDTLNLVQGFLGLPHQTPDLSRRVTKTRYEPMNPGTKKRLEEFYEPHNQRLYEYLGIDFEW
jgi:hypothetical protein